MARRGNRHAPAASSTHASEASADEVIAATASESPSPDTNGACATADESAIAPHTAPPCVDEPVTSPQVPFASPVEVHDPLAPSRADVAAAPLKPALRLTASPLRQDGGGRRIRFQEPTPGSVQVRREEEEDKSQPSAEVALTSVSNGVAAKYDTDRVVTRVGPGSGGERGVGTVPVWRTMTVFALWRRVWLRTILLMLLFVLAAVGRRFIRRRLFNLY